nr:hypothetical protein [Sphingomonas colocasiae]
MVAIFTGTGAGFDRGSGSVLGSMGLLGSASQGRGNEGIFVNAANGNLLLSKQDEVLIGRGPDAIVARTYNDILTPEENGDRWRYAYDRRVYGLTGTVNTISSTVKRLSADGSEITYYWDGTSKYKSYDGGGAHDTLEWDGTTWIWRDGNSRIKEEYESYGTTNGTPSFRLKKQSDTDGNTVTFTYSGARLSRSTTQDGGYIEYSWDGNGNISNVVTNFTNLETSAASTITRTSYEYESYIDGGVTKYRLNKVKIDLTPENGSDNVVYITTYRYDSSNRIDLITQSDDSSLAITYNVSGKVWKLEQTSTSGVTRKTELTYYTGYTTIEDPTGQITTLEYYTSGTIVAGNLKKITAPAAYSGAPQQTVEFTYYTDGNISTIKDSLGNTTTFDIYDTRGMANRIYDREGNAVVRTYGSNSELVLEQFVAADQDSGASNLASRYVYDSENHLRYMISADGRVTEYRYQSSGEISFKIEYPEHYYSVGSTVLNETTMDSWRDGLTDRSSTKITKYNYDARGNLTSQFSYGIANTSGIESNSEGYSQTNFIYDQAGQLLKRQIVGEGLETFVYDGMGRLTSVTDINGGTTTFVFNDPNTTTTVQLASGYVTTKTYNKAGDLLTQIDSGSYVTGGTTTNQYDKLGRLRVTTDASGRKTWFVYDKAGRKVADIKSYGTHGEVVEYRYDANNRVIATRRYATHLTPTELSTTFDNPDAVFDFADKDPAAHADDIWNWTVYDKEGRVLQSISGDGSTVVYAYDKSGRLVSTTNYTGKLTAGQISTLMSTPPTVVTLPTTPGDVSVARNFYDRDGRMIAVLDGEGYLSRTIFDGAGQKVKEIAYANATGSAGTVNRATASLTQLIASITASATADRTMNYVYDGQGLLRYAVDGLGQVTEYVYMGSTASTAVGRVRSTVRYAGTISTSDFTYDNVKSLVTPLASNTDNRKSWAVYDNKGRLIYSINASGAVTGFTYDNMGQITRQVEYATLRSTTSLPDQTTMDSWHSSNIGNAANRITRTWYSARGEVRFTVDAEGYIVRNGYNAAGDLVTVTAWDNPVTATDSTTIAQVDTLAAGAGTSRAQSFSYDVQGRLLLAQDAEGVETAYEYYATGLLKARWVAYGTADVSATTFGYDLAGRLISQYDAYGTTEQTLTTYAYDGLGNLTSTTNPRNQTTTYTYDKLGQVKTAVDAAGTTSYDYNAFGEAWKVTDGRNNATYSWFDRLGRVTHVQDALNYVTTTSYTVFGEILNVKRWATAVVTTPAIGTPPSPSGTVATTAFTYDKQGMVLSSTDANSQTESYAYNAFGDRTTVTNRLTLATTYSYDRLGRLTRTSYDAATVNHNAGGTVVTGNQIVKTYSYDAYGNRKQMVEGFSTTAGGAVTALRTTDYTYDRTNQLTEIKHDSVTVIADDMVTTSSTIPKETYAYDKRGNLIKFVDAGLAATFSYYDDLNRKIAEIRQLNGTQGAYTSYTYDNNGNISSTKVYETMVTLPSSAGGTPPTVPSGVFRETAFTYDNADRMLTSTIVSNTGNVITTGNWNGSSYVTTTGNLQTQYEYDANGNVVKLIDANTNAAWSWYDKLNRKTHQLDAEGYITKWDYDAEGNVLVETRYATKFTGTPNVSTPPTVSTHGDDRITTYTYDANGNRRTETRSNVTAWTVNASTGAVSAAGTSAVIEYTYNALNQVLTKTVAGAVIATYTYHNSGRLENEQRASYSDANSTTGSPTTVTPTTIYAYNATGDLTRQTQSGNSGTYSAADRVTNYRYGEGGRLISTTDAEGNVHNYFYDAAGRLKKDGYTRIINASTASNSATTSTVTEAITTSYDMGGRALKKGVYSTIGGTFKLVDYMSFQYNVFDQVTQQGQGSNSSTDINSGSALYQVTNVYDAAGNLVASNAGDGIWDFYSYDKVGNQTGVITSAGASDTGTNFATALAKTIFADVNGTWTVYDKRGLARQVIEEGRDRMLGGSSETLTTSRAYNAFGEKSSETDALNNTITYTYNTMGRMIRSESPAIRIKDETGAEYWVKPSEDYYYDLGGRLVATRDANGTYAKTGTAPGTATSKATNTGNLLSYDLLAGTGYDGSQSLISTEFHSDGGKKQTLYDRMGDARVLRSEIFDYANVGTTTLAFTEQSFNKLGQLTQVKHARYEADTGDSKRLIDNYRYDQFGQRIQHTNNLYGSSVVEKTGYDAIGRVTSQTDMENHLTTTAYAWDGTLATGGLLTFGGWAETTSYSPDSSLTSTIKSDIYNREVYKSDLGGHVFTTTYDNAGRMTTRSASPTATQTWYWYNTGLLYQSAGLTGIATFSYDKVGNRLTEKLENVGTTIKDASATYDALGRLTTFTQASAYYLNGSASYTNPDIYNEYFYDANGNIRQTISTYDKLNNDGTVLTANATDNFWYRYDSMNRLVVDKGKLSGTAGTAGTTIVRRDASLYGQANSVDIGYDQAGQRTYTVRSNFTSIPGSPFTLNTFTEVREIYAYFGNGTLKSISTTEGTMVLATFNAGTGLYEPNSAIPAAPTTGGTPRSSFSYDLMGRQTAQTDYDTNGTSAVYNRSSTYNMIGQLTYESSSTLKTDGKTYGSTSSYSYSNSGGYLLGAVYQVSGTSSVSGTSTKSTLTTNSYEWYDGAVQSSISYKPDTGASTTYTTTFYNNAFGQPYEVNIADGRPRRVFFMMDTDGQILRRDEVDGNLSNGDPHEVWYRFNGRELGYTGNDSTDNLNEAASVADRRVVTGSGAFHNGSTTGAAYTDTSGGSYEALNSFNQGSSAGGYVVQSAGENLRSVALALWGDASLWYKLAEANGLQADTALIEGQRLNVPAGVTRSGFSADTLKPYDPNDTIGNVSPTTPKPKKPNKCGAFGQILLMAVAIAATVILKAPIVKALGPVLGGAATGAAASVISQGIGLATGIQSKFSFKGVAMSAIGAGVGAGLDKFMPSNIAGSAFLGDAARGALGSAISQGIGVATGLQNKFSWTGVAVAGIGEGVGAGVAREFGRDGGLFGIKATNGKFGNDFISTSASVMANAATRSALSGGSFGDNLMRGLPDAIGGLLGRTLGKAGNEVITDITAKTEQVSGNPVDRNRSSHIQFASNGMINGMTKSDSSSYMEDIVSDIIITAKIRAAELKEDGRGILDRIDRFLGFSNLSGNYPHKRRNSSERDRTYEASLRIRASSGPKYHNNDPGSYLFAPDHPVTGSFTTRSRTSLLRAGDAIGGLINSNIGNGTAFDKYVSSPGRTGLNFINDNVLGPGTLYDTAIAKPVYALTGLADSVDQGLIMTLETSGVLRPLGMGLSGLRSLNALRAQALAAETAVPQVTANRLAGNAFRDEIAAALRAEGRGVQTEVYKKTPFGARYMDIEVSDVPGGTVLGGIETKLGNSRYTPSQRAKDMFLKMRENYPVNVVREPR